jgi:hypothetical protein
MICGLIVNTMLAVAPEILDLPPDQPLLEAEMTENFVQQMRLVLLGAACWREEAVPAAPLPRRIAPQPARAKVLQ